MLVINIKITVIIVIMLRRSEIDDWQKLIEIEMNIWDIGRSIWNIGRNIWNIGRNIWDIGRNNGNIDRNIWDIGRNIWNIGRNNWNIREISISREINCRVYNVEVIRPHNGRIVNAMYKETCLIFSFGEA